MSTNGHVAVLRSDDLAKVLGPYQLGQLAIWKNHEPGWEVSALVRSDAAPVHEDLFVEWVTSALKQLAETQDPHRNGWFRSARGQYRWYMTCVLRYLPSPD